VGFRTHPEDATAFVQAFVEMANSDRRRFEHYVVGAQYDTGPEFLKNVTLWYACPWTLSTAVVLGGSLGMVAIGAV
jgi:hypothetical protein